MLSRERVGSRRATFLAVSVAAHAAAVAAMLLASSPGPSSSGRQVHVQLVSPGTPSHATIRFPSARRAAGAPRSRRPVALARASAPPGAAAPVPSAPIPAESTRELHLVSEGDGAAAVPFAGDEADRLGVATSRLADGPPFASGEEALRAGPDSSWLDRHLSSIQRRLQREIDTKPYPIQARRMWWTGRGEVTFVIARDGSVLDVRVTRSTGHAVLDRQAVETVLDAAPYPRPPVDQEVVIPFRFQLM